MTKFINFGCWNKYGCSEASAFLKIKNEASKINDIDFIIVNGDNYYQDKKNGIKTVNAIDLLNGLNCLNQITDKDIYMLLGNHDLEITDGKCETLSFEKAFADGVNSQAKRNKFQLPDNLTMFKEIGDTLIIMLDSNIYADENPSCFNIIQNNNLFINKNIEEQLDILKEQQFKTIENFLLNKKYVNIIICTHHPLIGFKNQTIKNEMVNNKMKTKIKGGIDIINVALYKLFLDLLLLHAENFFYLCADIHNYQEGIVTINDLDKTIKIKQYIVGIGGTDLDDDYNEKYQIDYGVNTIVTEADSILTTNVVIKDNISLTYDLQKHFSDYGFIVVEINNTSNVNINAIIISKKGGNKSKKRVTYKFKTKKNKTMKKYNKI
jgi:hypothetical protein